MDEVHEHLAGADMIFITAGMGGGTGTGASPIIGEIAKNLGALTIAVVMKPFDFEGGRRMEAALKGIEELKEKVDTMIVIPNQRLLEIMEPKAPFLDAMRKSDEVLLQAVKSIANLSSQTGLINVDFADVRSVMDDAGTALMGLGYATGEDRAVRAAQMAIESPLLEVRVDGATGVLFNVVGGRDLGIQEIDDAAQVIKSRIDPNANFIFGAMIDNTVEDESFQVTVIATGFTEEDSARILSMGQQQRGRMIGLASRQIPQQTTQSAVTDTEEDSYNNVTSKGNIFQQRDKQPIDEDLDELPSFLRKRGGA